MDFGIIEYETVVSEVEGSSLEKNKRNSYRKFSSKERYEIGNYASVNKNSAAIKHFKSKILS